MFAQPTLNAFMALSHQHWKEARATIKEFLSYTNPVLKDDKELKDKAFFNLSDVTMHLPADIGDYTDFYSSLDHAFNIGTMFRYGQ